MTPKRRSQRPGRELRPLAFVREELERSAARAHGATSTTTATRPAVGAFMLAALWELAARARFHGCPTQQNALPLP